MFASAANMFRANVSMEHVSHKHVCKFIVHISCLNFKTRFMPGSIIYAVYVAGISSHEI